MLGRHFACHSNDYDDCLPVVVDAAAAVVVVGEQRGCGCDFGVAAAAVAGDDVVAIWGTKIVVLVC